MIAIDTPNLGYGLRNSNFDYALSHLEERGYLVRRKNVLDNTLITKRIAGIPLITVGHGFTKTFTNRDTYVTFGPEYTQILYTRL